MSLSWLEDTEYGLNCESNHAEREDQSSERCYRPKYATDSERYSRTNRNDDACNTEAEHHRHDTISTVLTNFRTIVERILNSSTSTLACTHEGTSERPSACTSDPSAFACYSSAFTCDRARNITCSLTERLNRLTHRYHPLSCEFHLQVSLE
ncbi:hypothetical protein HZS55_12965 [Halosimplex rubrum]|uniref:Uncharacterized protein n=1 Tax=Halosimplex rubrum TaxID=869889 RepID=A0A7D5PB73_9EURY|nr:hypothetical protein [Halosimplex rubrum]QLH78159.1 hypothetical protein HZS55_12965 [Halosimplex rubrum]